MKMIPEAEYDALIAARDERDRLRTLINTPELVDFPKAVLLESVHQEQRWGTDDREGKKPYDWHWLVAHLCGRALEHHKEADRMEANITHGGLDVCLHALDEQARLLPPREGRSTLHHGRLCHEPLARQLARQAHDDAGGDLPRGSLRQGLP